MKDVAHWRLKKIEPAPASRLAGPMAVYDGSRTKREHDLHCSRVLREKTDGLRQFKDLPVEPSKAVRPRKGGIKGAYHRVSGNHGRI